MKRKLINFLRKDTGAVTVDWVVLCAGIVGLCLIAFNSMQDGTLGLAGNVEAFFADWTF